MQLSLDTEDSFIAMMIEVYTSTDLANDILNDLMEQKDTIRECRSDCSEAFHDSVGWDNVG